jgi:hypothetical protein
MERFAIAEVLDEAWVSTKRHYWRWLLVLVVALVIPIALFILGGVVIGLGASDESGFLVVLGALVFVIAALAAFYVLLGLIRNAFHVSQGQAPSIGLLLQSARFWWFLVAGVVYIGTVVLGLILFVIPGLIFALMFGLFGYALVATREMNGFAALGMSWDRISRHFWSYLGLRVLVIGFSVALAVVLGLLQGLGVGLAADSGGIIAAIVGIIVTILIALAYVFAIAFLYTTDAIAFRRLAGEFTIA